MDERPAYYPTQRAEFVGGPWDGQALDIECAPFYRVPLNAPALATHERPAAVEQVRYFVYARWLMHRPDQSAFWRYAPLGAAPGGDDTWRMPT